MAVSSGRVLVTGGAGLIGSHLCERLLDAGNDVLCLDNFSTSADRNMQNAMAHPKFKILNHDICQPFSGDMPAVS